MTSYTNEILKFGVFIFSIVGFGLMWAEPLRLGLPFWIVFGVWGWFTYFKWAKKKLDAKWFE